MLARISVVRRMPKMAAVSARYKSSQVEGTVAQDRAFGKREKAHEDEYARRHERELLEKMKLEIEKKKLELSALEQKHQELQKDGK